MVIMAEGQGQAMKEEREGPAKCPLRFSLVKLVKGTSPEPCFFFVVVAISVTHYRSIKGVKWM